MSPIRQPVESMVQRWVRLYTLGLTAPARDERRAEIDSDLWEHRNHAVATGEAPAATSLAILGRWAAGVPADLSWRASQTHRHTRTTEETIMANPPGRYWWQALAALTAAITVYGGFRQFFTNEVSATLTPGKVAGLVLSVVAGLVIVLGLALHRTGPRQGAAMVIVGVLPAALMGGLGLGVVLGPIASLAGGEGWWWAPAAIASAVATIAGFGAFSAWWNANPASATLSQRVNLFPMTLVLVGVLAAGVGVGLGGPPILWALGAVTSLIGLAVWRRRLTTP